MKNLDLDALRTYFVEHSRLHRYAPEQRFHQLMKRYPQIMNNVPFGEIASYLNISLRKLHKIRDNMESKHAE